MPYLFEGFSLDTERRELRRDGDMLSIEPKVFDLLVHLIANRERVVSKDDLVAAIWGGRVVSETALTTCVNAVRRAVGDNGKAQRWIKTLPRKGFRFVGDVREERDLKHRGVGENSPDALKPALALPDKPSVAVLPFANLSDDPEQEYFADGMVEDIITGLSRFRSLFVIARNSSFAYKGRSPDVRQVGRELGVRYVLEGSVRKAGVRVRIAGQLVDAANGVHLWADRFDGELADVFELQDRVTSSVVGIIAPMVEQAELARARSKPTGSLQAYDKLLRAVALERSRSRRDLEEAIGILREVIRSDPEYARAYAQLSRVCWVYVGQGYGHRDHALVSDFAALAQRGLELDPTDAQVMVIAALAIAYAGGDIQAGLDLVEKAIRLNPNFAGAYLAGGVLNGYLGEVDRALECIQHADRLNPLAASFSANDVRFIASFGVSDHEAVVDETARGLREHPNSGPALRYRAASLALLGRIEEARKIVGRLTEARPGYCIAEVRRHYEFDLNNPFKKPGVTESLYRGLRLAGLPE